MDTKDIAPQDEKKAVAAPVFDLDKFDVLEKANTGVEFELKTEDGQPTNLFLRVLGKDSDVIREILFDQQTRRMQAMSDNDGKFKFDARQTEEDGLHLLSSAVTSWSVGQKPWLGHVFRAGQKVECSKDAVAELFRRYPAFRDQTDEFIGKRAHFTKG